MPDANGNFKGISLSGTKNRWLESLDHEPVVTQAAMEAIHRHSLDFDDFCDWVRDADPD